jgi:RNA polymerase Rpb6
MTKKTKIAKNQSNQPKELTECKITMDDIRRSPEEVLCSIPNKFEAASAVSKRVKQLKLGADVMLPHALYHYQDNYGAEKQYSFEIVALLEFAHGCIKIKPKS